ncbi:unnamed protein product [Durusdinium trenchii]|uniref:Methyltransferase type 12 domain-containing protein n=1 Tax=Durusdinium trenchii TaxID=1381693 RepID=A0ABP0L786_9DINO
MIHRISAALLAVAVAVDVTAPLRSGPLVWHLQWDSMLVLAETVLRERVEAELFQSFARLRKRIFRWSPQVWASAGLSELQSEMQSTWQSDSAFHMAAEDNLGLLHLLRDYLKGLEEDWKQMSLAVVEWNGEAQRVASHVPVNFQILLKQASVLQGLLAASPGFAECLEHVLREARQSRPSNSVYESAVWYVQTAQWKGPLYPKVSVFSARQVPELGLSQLMRSLTKLLESLDWLKEVEEQLFEVSDGCLGPQAVYEGTDGTLSCTHLAKEFARLRALVIGWMAVPEEFLQHFSRWQFSVAPNVTRLEALTLILEQVFACQYGSGLTDTFDRNGTSGSGSTLDQIAADDKASLDEEYHLFLLATQRLQTVAQSGTRRTEPALESGSLIKELLDLKFVIHLVFDEASTWAFRVKTRGNGLQLRLEDVAGKLSFLHTALQLVPNYRTLAFQEIHSAGHWGRSSSGGGSSEGATSTIAEKFLKLMQKREERRVERNLPSISVLDIGCGWGEWLPSMLLEAITTGALQKASVKRNGQKSDGKAENTESFFRYWGIDIAEKPISVLRARFQRAGHSGDAFHFVAMDACRDELPGEFDLVVVRHVFQHLNLADAFSLLRNLRRTYGAGRLVEDPVLGPDDHWDPVLDSRSLLLLSSWPKEDGTSMNQDLIGGSSAFDSLSPSYTRSRFKGYDLRKAPFNLPEPLQVWQEKSGEELLLYSATVLNSIDFADEKHCRCTFWDFCPRVLRGPMPGGWTSSRAPDASDLEVWKKVITDVNKDLSSFGQPTEVSTQVVAGLKYKFGFQNGAEVTVYSRPWEKHLEVLEVKKGTSLDAQGWSSVFHGPLTTKEAFLKSLVTQKLRGYVLSDTGLNAFAPTAREEFEVLLSQLKKQTWLCGGLTGHACDAPDTAPLFQEDWQRVVNDHDANKTAQFAKQVVRMRGMEVQDEEALRTWARSQKPGSRFEAAFGELTEAPDALCGGTATPCKTSHTTGELTGLQQRAVWTGTLAFLALCVTVCVLVIIAYAVVQEDKRKSTSHDLQMQVRNSKLKYQHSLALREMQSILPQAKAAAPAPRGAAPAVGYMAGYAGYAPVMATQSHATGAAPAASTVVSFSPTAPAPVYSRGLAPTPPTVSRGTAVLSSEQTLKPGC